MFDGHVEQLDHKQTFDYDWGSLSASFKYSWPKGQVGQKCPY